MDKTAITTVAAKTAFKLKKYAPEILTGVGIVGVVTAGVLASRATLKLEPILDRTNEGLEVIKNRTEDEKYETKQERQKDLAVVYVNTTLDLVKIYGPSVSLALASIGCIVGAHGIMQKRNASLLVALKTVETAYNKYRSRVISELGIDQERDIYLDIQEEEVEDEKGKKKIIAKVGDGKHSIYAKIFDEHNVNWRNDAGLNQYFLEAVQRSFNDRLAARGHVFLNEIYEELGFEHTREGAVTGWIYNLEQGGKDGYIDFNIYEFEKEAKREFLLGHEKSIVLDFNVDGVIWDKI